MPQFPAPDNLTGEGVSSPSWWRVQTRTSTRSTKEVQSCTKVLVPLDESPLAEVVLNHVEALAPLIGAEVILLRILSATGVLPETAQEEEQAAREYLERVAEWLQGKGIRVRHTIRHGDSAPEILDYAEVNEVDLIAMSAHGHSGISRWVFGSIAEKVLRGTNILILVVRSADAPTGR